MLYDKSVAELMKEAAASLPEPMTVPQVIAWFKAHYPKVQAGTVRAHVIGLTINNQTNKHYPSLAKRPPIFYQSGKGILLRFDPALHVIDQTRSSYAEIDEESGSIDDYQEQMSATPSTMEFALEVYLEEFLITNWELIDWGRRLHLWEDDRGLSGHQLSTPIGRLDLLARDVDSDGLVVIELKRGRTSDQVVGQVARYMGWVRKNLARPDQQVEGIVVAGNVDDRLRYAVSAVPGLSVLIYQVSFALADASSFGLDVV